MVIWSLDVSRNLEVRGTEASIQSSSPIEWKSIDDDDNDVIYLSTTAAAAAAFQVIFQPQFVRPSQAKPSHAMRRAKLLMVHLIFSLSFETVSLHI